MPPAANDNQGLKIAVAIFATLSFMLAIATYFGFSQAAQNWERSEDANKKASAAIAAQNALQNSFNEFKALAGYEKTADNELKTQFDADQKALTDAVNALSDKLAAVYSSYRTAAGDAASQQVDEFAEQARTSAERITNDRTRTLQSTITALTDLLTNDSQLLGSIAADYQATRRSLEASNQVAQQKVAVEIQEKEKAQQEKIDAARKHEEDRKSIVSRLEELQARNSQQATQIASLTNELAQTKDDMQRRYNGLMAQFRVQREQLEKSELVLEAPNGQITFVDNTRGEVRTNMSRRMGAREQMVFSVFDRDAVGVPTERPKGTVELLRVDDRGSIGRIIKTTSLTDPINAGDHLYSPAFGAQPRSFALIGKIDIDQDGKDDREDLKRMIRSRGGEVTFDLPPPGFGEESGELTPLTSWYVLDDRQAFHPGSEIRSGATAEEESAYNKKRTEALTEARLAGIRPISIERLLSMLGYKYGESTPGRVERLDRDAYRRLINPQGNAPPTTPPPGSVDPNFDGNGRDTN